MTYVPNDYREHWLDSKLCTPGSHDSRIDREHDTDRLQRIVKAIFTCSQCPVDSGLCLENGVRLESDGVFGGVLLEGGKPVNPRRQKKVA